MKNNSEKTPLTVGLKKENAFSVGYKAFFKGETWARIKAHKQLYLLVLPAVLLVVVFSYGPMLGLLMAFEDYKMDYGILGSEWIGLKTFRKILFAENNEYYLYFRNTMYIAIIRIATNFPLIIIFTLLINEIQRKRFKSLVQAISYIPNFISWVAVGGMMYSLLTYDGGIVNRLFNLDIHWYDWAKPWWIILAVSSLWKGLGWGTLLYLSSIGTINEELYDACTIDGGGRLTKAWTVTLPGIINIIIFQLILDCSSLLRDNYDQVIALTYDRDGLRETTKIIGSVAYSAIMKSDGLSMPTALGLIQSVVAFIMVIFTDNIAKKMGNEGML